MEPYLKSKANGERDKLVSIIVPIYKAEKYLHRCIDSILCQSYKKLELILIDAGSPDECGEICGNYASLDNRIKVNHIENSGVSGARNAGIRIATGHYIVFVDSDDHISGNAIELLYSTIVTGDLDFVLADHMLVSSGVTLAADPARKLEANIFCSAYDFIFYFSKANKVGINSPVARIFKTSIISENNIFFPEDLSLGEDLLFNLEYSSFCERIQALPDVIYFYESTENSLSTMPRNNLVDVFLCHYEAKKTFFTNQKRYGAVEQCVISGTLFLNLAGVFDKLIDAGMERQPFCLFLKQEIYGKCYDILKKSRVFSPFQLLVYVEIRLHLKHCIYLSYKIKKILKRALAFGRGA